MTKLSPLSLALSAATLSLVLLGCSSSDTATNRPRLGDIRAFDYSILQQDAPVTEQQLAQLYQQILQLEPAAQTRQKIQYRLSQMQTAALDKAEYSPEEESEQLQQLIAQYQQLLSQYPTDPNNELIRYQLARSYDLLGLQQQCLEQLELFLQQYPQSDFAPEVWFRKADIHYSRSHYADALDAYLQVLDSKVTELVQHARYMSGWSYFKLQQFEQADEQFLRVLDRNYSGYLADAGLQQSLQQEVLRTLSVSLSYQQQGDSLQALLRRVPYYQTERPLELVETLYRALAEFLAEKQLLSASLDTYRLFISDYPATLAAARLQLLLIEHYLADADADRAQAEQQRYISLFGYQTAFWQQASGAELTEVAPLLLQYLDYFSRKQYLSAQQQTGASQAQAFSAVLPMWQQMLSILAEPLLQNAGLQQQYSSADLRYLLAESYVGATLNEQALALYTELGYQALPGKASLFSAEDAAYKALLLADKLSPAYQDNGARLWQQQTDFVRVHSQHSAAQQVALQQLQQRYNSARYAEVLTHSNSVIDWPHPAQTNATYVLEARFLHSQSELALNQYASAEASISALLNSSRKALGVMRVQQLTEQLASSIYQQAQQPQLADDDVLAHLARLLQTLPDSAYHQAAAYQQISLMHQAQQFTAVIPLLKRFIAQYANSERYLSAKALLLDSYEQAGQWGDAAAELLQLAGSSSDEQQQREALYLAAQYQHKAGDSDGALNSYRSYANRYPQPHLLAQEARQQLAGLYQQKQDKYRQNFWLDKITSFEQQFAGDGNDRSRQLAAEAALALARHESNLYSAVRLGHPLRSSLAKKRQHMTVAIKRLEQSMQYGIAGLYSEAQFRVAQLYQQMATALLQSDRPKGLDELALEEYELLLEEQAYPFEEQAIAIYQQNARLTHQQLWDDWIAQSFAQLAALLPAKFDKTEQYTEVADDAF